MMSTDHRIYFQPADRLNFLEDNSVALVVTSPPYPMIEMWDQIFASQNPRIQLLLDTNDGKGAFELMHAELAKVWKEMYRVLKPGGIACINIGDATRTIDKNFQLYPNHAKIIEICHQNGFQSLPEILWRKQTNAPNKFMGSGMLPPGAYVTLEHEYILIFRKGPKRDLTEDSEKQVRRESGYFWEERNIWFSDVWDFKGATQIMNSNGTRERSAAFPFELAFRLINMFSTKNELVLDPFVGTGTTIVAAMTAERHSIGIEIDPSLQDSIAQTVAKIQTEGNLYLSKRLENHQKFIAQRVAEERSLKYHNEIHHFDVMTNQETQICIRMIELIRPAEKMHFLVDYTEKGKK